VAEEIVIRTANPNDITLEESEEIAKAVRGLNLNCDVRVEGQQREGMALRFSKFCGFRYSVARHSGWGKRFKRK
jgi:hypothetical protein